MWLMAWGEEIACRIGGSMDSESVHGCAAVGGSPTAGSAC